MRTLLTLTLMWIVAPNEAMSQGGCEEVMTCCNRGRDAKPWKGFQRGVRWENSLEEAKMTLKRRRSCRRIRCFVPTALVFHSCS